VKVKEVDVKLDGMYKATRAIKKELGDCRLAV
jgi:hypothetical protein